ncbi:MAG: hypothetical protein R8G66_20740 [Cytophagales bacterium]|nr:hypothetical protein [Cytophagales bacterium]
MKFFNNMKLRLSIGLMALVMVFTACEDPDKAPIVTFDSAGHGIYPRLISEDGALLVNLLTETDFNSSNYSYTVEFVDDNAGQNVAEVYVEVVYNPVGGSAQAAVEVTRVGASALTASENGFLQTTFDVSSTAITSAIGLGYADFAAGDEFQLSTVIVHVDGTEYRSTNSSSSVRGAAFRGGRFAFTRPLACPSALEGTYSYATTDIWCGGADVTGTVELQALGGGRYQFDDWAFGAYGPCYGGGGASGDLTFTDVCEVVSFTGFTDSFGDTWTYTSSISGEEWTIAWDNTYGESATSVITFPGGVPFTLAP